MGGTWLWVPVFMAIFLLYSRSKGDGAPNSIGAGGNGGQAIIVTIDAGANVTQN
jgi:hypothetical protein